MLRTPVVDQGVAEIITTRWGACEQGPAVKTGMRDSRGFLERWLQKHVTSPSGQGWFIAHHK